MGISLINWVNILIFGISQIIIITNLYPRRTVLSEMKNNKLFHRRGSYWRTVLAEIMNNKLFRRRGSYWRTVLAEMKNNKLFHRRGSERQCGIKILGVIFLCMCALLYIFFHFRLSNSSFGILLFGLIIPTLTITAILTVYHRRYSDSFFILGFACQIIHTSSSAFSHVFSQIFNAPYKSWVYLILIPAFSFALSYGLFLLMNASKNLSKKDRKFITLFSANVITGLLIFTVYFSLLSSNFIRHRWLFPVNIIIISLFSFSCVLFMILFSRYEREKQTSIQKQEELKHLMTYAATIEEMYNKMTSLRHDYKNMLISLRHDEASQKKLEKLLTEAFSNNEHDFFSEGLASICNLPVKSLLAVKLMSFSSQSVNVSFKVLGGKIENLFIDDIDAVRILGILLDNAFEEAVETEEKIINILAVRYDDKINIFVENSCRDTLPEIQNLFKRGFSTKGENRGIGLSNFREIISNYPFCSFSMSRKENNMFSAELSLSEERIHSTKITQTNNF